MTEAENSSNQAPQPLPQVQSRDEVQPDQNPNAYNAASIQILEGLEAVRKRPGMYIGDTADGSGLHHLVYEVLDNSIDEALAGFASHIEVTIHTDNSISVTDDGRGIPTAIKWDDKHDPKRSAAEIALTELHAGGKFDNNGYKIRDGEARTLEFRRGKVVNRLIENAIDPATGKNVRISPMALLGPTNRRGTEVHFLPDLEIFEQVTEFSYETLLSRLRELSFLYNTQRSANFA